MRIGCERREVFLVALVDSQLRLIEAVELHRGATTQVEVHPREVALLALKANARGVFLMHNHPSGDLIPSRADILITERIKEALAVFDMLVFDHVIATPEGYVSLAKKGHI